jgi:hypothetical protein
MGTQVLGDLDRERADAAPPGMNTRWPALRCNSSRNACSAVSAASGTAVYAG